MGTHWKVIYHVTKSRRRGFALDTQAESNLSPIIVNSFLGTQPHIYVLSVLLSLYNER